MSMNNRRFTRLRRLRGFSQRPTRPTSLSTKSPPITYSLIQIPTACMNSFSQCIKIDRIIQFPATDFSPASLSPLHWSPDGSKALLLNTNGSELLMLDSSISKVFGISINFQVISDQIVWSPDGNKVAISVQDPDPYGSRVVLFEPLNNDFQYLSTDLEGMLFPIGWINTKELVLLQVRYEYSTGDIRQKKVIAGQSLIKMNTNDLTYEILIPNLVLRGDSLPSVSSDGTMVAATVVRNDEAFLDIYSIEGILLRSFGAYTNPRWSSDNRHIAGILQEGNGYSVVTLDLEGEVERNMANLASLPELTWFPNGIDLLIATRNLDEMGSDEMFFYINSSSNGENQEIDLDGVTKGELIVISISFRPGNFP